MPQTQTALDLDLLPVSDQAPNIQVQDIIGPAGKPIPLNISIEHPTAATSGMLFIFSGIPDGVVLHPGGDFGRFWAVNSKVFHKLTLTAGKNLYGSFDVTVTQTGKSAITKRNAVFTVTILRPVTPETRETVAAIPSERLPHNKPLALPRPSKDVPNLRDDTLMERATRLFSDGDISGARTVFAFLASRGNADAAIALGGTYDPKILGQLLIRGLDPDPEKAREWYRRAEELGSVDAKSRLDALVIR